MTSHAEEPQPHFVAVPGEDEPERPIVLLEVEVVARLVQLKK